MRSINAHNRLNDDQAESTMKTAETMTAQHRWEFCTPSVVNIPPLACQPETLTTTTQTREEDNLSPYQVSLPSSSTEEMSRDAVRNDDSLPSLREESPSVSFLVIWCNFEINFVFPEISSLVSRIAVDQTHCATTVSTDRFPTQNSQISPTMRARRRSHPDYGMLFFSNFQIFSDGEHLPAEHVAIVAEERGHPE